MTWADDKYPYTKKLFFTGVISKPLLLSLSVNRGMYALMVMPLGQLSSRCNSLTAEDRAEPLPTVWSCRGERVSRAGKRDGHWLLAESAPSPTSKRHQEPSYRSALYNGQIFSKGSEDKWSFYLLSSSPQ